MGAISRDQTHSNMGIVLMPSAILQVPVHVRSPRRYSFLIIYNPGGIVKA